ncbi:MAG: Tol biopolymer transport system component, partial [Pseudohongiellaceae bacterium]
LNRYDLSTDTVSRVTEVGAARGGTFTGDGRILYTPNFRSGLFLVDADGSGAPVELTIRDPDLHTSHRWPTMIAGTDRFMYSAVTATVGENDNNGLYLGSLDGSEPPRRVMSSHYSAQVIDGMLLHVKDGSLLATPIDPDSGTLGGRATTLAKGLVPDASTWHGQFSASPSGVLVLSRLPSTTDGPSTKSYNSAYGDRISYWSYDGRPVRTYAGGTPMYGMSLRPGGQMLAAEVLSPDGFSDVWLYPARLLNGQDQDDVEAGTVHVPAPQRLTFLPGAEYEPVWSPDGKEVAFFWDGDDDRPRGIYRKRIGGGTEALVRDNQGRFDHPTAWTPDGRFLILTTDTRLISDQNDVIAVPLDGGPDVPLVVAPDTQNEGRVSPDGRWLAYNDLTDGETVFVIPFAPAWPGSPPEGRWLVSENSGYEPRWSPSGDELFYMSDTGVLTAVDVETGGESFSFSSPEALFQTPWNLDRSYEPIPDHEGNTAGFAFLDSDVAVAGPISVILGWQELLGDR